MSGIKEIKNLKEFSTSLERFEGGHRLCPGCSHSIIVREILNATDYNLVVGYGTGSLRCAHLSIRLRVGMLALSI